MTSVLPDSTRSTGSGDVIAARRQPPRALSASPTRHVNLPTTRADASRRGQPSCVRPIRARRSAPAEDLVEGRVLRTSAGGRPAAPRRATASRMFPSPPTECASVEQTTGTPASTASRTSSSRRSSLSGRPLVSIATPSSSATSSTRSRSSAFGGRWLMIRPVGWLRQRTAGCRIASVTFRVSCVARLALAGVQAQLHPVELREHVVGQVERRRRGGCRTPPRAARGTARARSFTAAISSRLPPERRPRRARARRARSACGRRSRRTRSRGRARRDAPSPGPIALPSDHVVWHVQVAADLRRARRAAAAAPRNGRSRSSGGHHGSAERRVHAPPRPARPAAAPSASTYSRVAGRTHELGAEARRARRRRARPGHPRPLRRPRGARSRSTTDDDLRQRRECVEHRFRLIGARRRRSRSTMSAQRRGSPATSPPSASAISSASVARTVERQSAALGAALARSSALEQLRLRLRARCPAPCAAVPPRPPRGTRRRSRRRAPARSPPCASAPSPSNRPSPTSSGSTRLARARRSSSMLARLDQLAQPRLDAGPDAAQLLRAPLRDELRDRRRGLANQSRRPAGTRAPCSSSPRPGRAVPRTPRAARRCTRCHGG